MAHNKFEVADDDLGALQKMVSIILTSRGLGLGLNVTFLLNLRFLRVSVFSIATCGGESWMMLRCDRKRIGVFEKWCYRRLLNVPHRAIGEKGKRVAVEQHRVRSNVEMEYGREEDVVIIIIMIIIINFINFKHRQIRDCCPVHGCV